MTNHASHSHPATPAARAACRKASAYIAAQPNHNPTNNPVVAASDHRAMTEIFTDELAEMYGEATMIPSHVDGQHCQACGANDMETIMTADQGYSPCCNEPLVSSCDPTYCYHR